MDDNQFSPFLYFGQVNNFVVFKSFFLNRSGNIFALILLVSCVYEKNVYGEQCSLSLYLIAVVPKTTQCLKLLQNTEPEPFGAKGVYDKHLNTMSYAVRCSQGENSWTLTDSNIIS